MSDPALPPNALRARAADDGLPTVSSRVQAKTEDDVAEVFGIFNRRWVSARRLAARTRTGRRNNNRGDDGDDPDLDDGNNDDGEDLSPFVGVRLRREVHLAFLKQGLDRLSGGFESLDASRPWIVYWTIHSIALLGGGLGMAMVNRIVDFLGRCQASTGGFGGGPGQMAHLAPTYAAVCTLATLGTDEALAAIDRPALQAWLGRIKRPDGSFCMHEDGENDSRSTYCAIHVASLTNVLTEDLAAGVVDFLVACQSWDGGISALPGTEAHGGYSFCGLAALVLLRGTHRLDLARLVEWATQRQMSLEGGFQGRTNKLVDGCYSFWQGGIFPLINAIVAGRVPAGSDPAAEPYAPTEIYPWVPHHVTAKAAPQKAWTTVGPLAAAVDTREDQDGEGNDGNDDDDDDDGGVDVLEPNMFRAPASDLLCDSLALQQYILVACETRNGGLRDKPPKRPDRYHTCYCLSGLSCAQHHTEDAGATVLGHTSNLLVTMDPVYAVVQPQITNAIAYYADLEIPSPSA